MKTTHKKKYSGVFRDGGAGANAIRRFRARRMALMRKENKLMAITGVPHGPGEETSWAYAQIPTYQEPAIMHLTGINQQRVILLLDPQAEDSDEILFIDRKNPEREFWDGFRFGVGDSKSARETRRVTGFKDVRDLADFKAVLRERFRRRKERRLGALWLAGTDKKGRKKVFTGDYNWHFKSKLAAWLREWKAPRGALTNVMRSHFELRLPLDKYDVANTRQAQEIAAAAFKETLRRFGEFTNECQVAAFLNGQMLLRSPYGLSFPIIAASGPNATVLHYVKNDDDFTKSELVLIDFGVRWMTMHADITRTVPASGKFNPLQKMLYEIVLRAQREVEKAARAGVTIEKLNEICWGAVNRGLDTDLRAAGGKFKLQYKKQPHGVSHLMGEQEHDGDPFRNYAREPMRAGWLISNEPGVYGHFKCRLGGKLYDEKIGIRIEDNLLITAAGCVNMSSSIPKTAAEIERLMRRR